ncbi:MAG: hypothetical protein LUC91_02855 [Prevotella sp.]|nr:hypothetical protein [Prevotella sp.]
MMLFFVGDIAVLLSRKIFYYAVGLGYFSEYCQAIKTKGTVLFKMASDMSFLGTAVVTMFSMLAGFIIFYYDALEHTNFGVSNRDIIGYTIGSAFMPMIFVADGLADVIMYFGYYKDSMGWFYLAAVYSLALSLLVVTLSIMPISKHYSFRIIMKTERKQYRSIYRAIIEKIKGDSSSDSEKPAAYTPDLDNVMNKMIYHSNKVMYGNEDISDKMAMIKAIFILPFMTKEMPGEKEDDQKERKQTKIAHRYFHLYNNMNNLACYLLDHQNDLKSVDAGLYENIYSIFEIDDCESNLFTADENILIYMGALFNAMIPVAAKHTETHDKENLLFGRIHAGFRYIIVDIISSPELRKLVLMEYLLAIVYLWYSRKVDIYEGHFCEEASEFMRKIDLKDRETPDLEKLKGIVCGWMKFTTENRHADDVREQIKSDISEHGRFMPVNFLYQIKWNYTLD